MADLQLNAIALALISGGAMGAIISNVLISYRTRIQPIGRRVEFLPLFVDTLGASSLHAKITVSDGQNDHSYTNLFIGRIQLANRATKTFQSSDFALLWLLVKAWYLLSLSRLTGITKWISRHQQLWQTQNP